MSFLMLQVKLFLFSLQVEFDDCFLKIRFVTEPVRMVFLIKKLIRIVSDRFDEILA